jgi:hypothetical protein
VWLTSRGFPTTDCDEWKRRLEHDTLATLNDGHGGGAPPLLML